VTDWWLAKPVRQVSGGAIPCGMKAHVVNGRLVVDVMPYNSEGDTLNDEERAALHRSLLRGIAKADAGQLIDADEVIAELDSPS
jgi:hypothetical protein